MDLIQKIKEKLTSLDVNSFMASIVSTVGAMNTSSVTQLVYLAAAVTAQLYSMSNVSRKEKLVREDMREDSRKKRLQNDAMEKNIAHLLENKENNSQEEHNER